MSDQYKFEMVMKDGKYWMLEVESVKFPSLEELVQPSTVLINPDVSGTYQRFQKSFREMFCEEGTNQGDRGQRPVGGRGDAEGNSR